MAIRRGWKLMEQGNARRLWNSVKMRHETWIRTSPAHDWLLVKGDPIDLTEDNFISCSHDLFPAIHGVSSQMHWWVTGRPNPTGANFTHLNELGGGVSLETRPVNGAWIAEHFGNVYPFTMALSPHLYLRSTVPNLSNIHIQIGLISEMNKPTNNSVHIQSDDGIWVEYDDTVDGNFRSITRTGGVQTSKILAAADTAHHNFCIRVNDAGDEVEFLIDGVVLQTHIAGDNLPTGVQLQPYFEVLTRENVLKSIHLHHYIQLFDAQWV